MGSLVQLRQIKSDFISHDLKYGIFCNFSRRHKRAKQWKSFVEIGWNF